MRYNLEVLNDKEFEDLAKDLLEARLSKEFEIFKAGKDGGIDLRYSGKYSNEIIVQVKHYIGSKFSDLKNQLVKEKENLDKLSDKPKRYIVFTSMALNPQEADEIKKILKPYVKKTGDIYNRRIVENLISKNPEIEKKYFKLWLTSTNIMERILHNAEIISSEFQEEKIKKRSKFYIQTTHLGKSFEILNKNKFIIISGEPGVGKTTLAYMLVYELLGNGFKLIYSDRAIRDAEQILSKKNEDKQVIFIDDFLGSNLADFYSPINPESTIIRFIEQIQSSVNKYLIFTSRTTLLKEANQRFEHFERERIKDISNYEIKVVAYTKLEKAKILYNHLYHFSMSEEFREVFFTNKNYLRIIEHTNYYPRLIEFLTQEGNFNHSGFSSVEKYLFANLDNPEKIWKMAFENQLSRHDQIFLETVFTFGDKGVDSEILQHAFDNRIEVQNRSRKLVDDVNTFNNCLIKLQDGFLKTEKDAKTRKLLISFINPSITDFLLDYLKDNHSERKLIWLSNIYIEQFEKRFGKDGNRYLTCQEYEKDIYINYLLDSSTSLRSVFGNQNCAYRILKIFFNMFPFHIKQKQEQVIELLHSVIENRARVDWAFYSILVDISLEQLDECLIFIEDNWDHFIDLMLENIDSADEIRYVIDIHKIYQRNLQDYLSVNHHQFIFNEAVQKVFQEILDDQDLTDCVIFDPEGNLYEDHSEQSIKDKAWDIYQGFLEDEELLDFVPEGEELYNVDIQKIVQQYIDNHNYYYDNISHSGRTNEQISAKNIDNEIERIFQR
ncbi:DNA polymerase III delta prime subunit [Sphingobacterium zeae]|uniref:DNA polymerase III delta prime subunit n=1 Tax=Sphingobacterium zeae TaxID=1776859 RepID=A0ABU0U5U1_9SPHI|nr:AAA family ATPase [Sphingobacterium zeae]MDQ1150330.1 DNA polymerase III delta prime subunit [Sphingobacterium zeae]